MSRRDLFQEGYLELTVAARPDGDNTAAMAVKCPELVTALENYLKVVDKHPLAVTEPKMRIADALLYCLDIPQPRAAPEGDRSLPLALGGGAGHPRDKLEDRKRAGSSWVSARIWPYLPVQAGSSDLARQWLSYRPSKVPP